MRLDRLSLKGVLAYSDQITLDLAAIPSGIIAIVGPNGSGKTSLIEAAIAALYRQLPSRGDVIDYATDRESFIALEATVDGRGQYRARLNLDNLRRASDAVLELVKPDGSRAVLNDGKVSTFDLAVAHEFPPLPLVLASAFAAQNRAGSFARLDRKGRKDVFAWLLGLEHYESMATTARTAATTVERRVIELHGRAAHLLSLTTDAQAGEIARTADRLQAERVNVELEGQEAQATVTRLEAEVAELRVRDERYAALGDELLTAAQVRAGAAAERERWAAEFRTRDHDETQARTAIDTRRRLAITQADAAIAALKTDAQLDQVLARRQQEIRQATAKQVADRRERLANNRGLLDRAEAIREEAAWAETTRQTIESLDVDVAVARTCAGEAERAVTAAQCAVDEVGNPEADLARARADAKLLERVPFGPKCAEAGCEFVRSAVEAREAITDLERRARVAATLRAELDARVLELVQARSRARDIEGRQATLRQELKGAATAGAQLEKLNAAEARVAELQQEIQTLEADAETAAQQARDDWWTHDVETRNATLVQQEEAKRAAEAAAEAERVALAATMEARRRELAVSGTVIDAALAAVVQQIQTLESERLDLAATHDELVSRERQLTHARATAAAIATRAASLAVELRAFHERREEFRVRLAERRQLETAIAALQTDLIEWQGLAKVFSRDGLPVLEIDAAGPGVSAIANDLLQACFGGRFTVELITQEAKAGGKGLKEAFELKVYDSERGGEARDLADLSGGEQVIVDEALKSAIAAFVNQRNVAPFRTVIRDETTGALDPENAVRYVQMLRRLYQVSGLHHLLYVTHSPVAAALADVQIVIADGRLDVRYPPFPTTFGSAVAA